VVSLLYTFFSGKEPMVPIVQEAEWAPEPVWTLWNTGEYLASAGNGDVAV
jgi:hypothetical protein